MKSTGKKKKKEREVKMDFQARHFEGYVFEPHPVYRPYIVTLLTVIELFWASCSFFIENKEKKKKEHNIKVKKRVIFIATLKKKKIFFLIIRFVHKLKIIFIL